MDKENMNPQDLGGIFQEESSPSPPEESKRTYIKQEKTDKPYWYVVYTYSGYENKVMTNLLKTVENNGLHDSILDVKVPMEETIEVKNGKKKHVQRKLYPGYVMVKMFLTDETWYVVRNTRVSLALSAREASLFPFRMRKFGRWAWRMSILSWMSRWVKM